MLQASYIGQQHIESTNAFMQQLWFVHIIKVTSASANRVTISQGLYASGKIHWQCQAVLAI